MKIKVEDIIKQAKLNIKPEQVCFFLDDLELVNKIKILQDEGKPYYELLEKIIIENQDKDTFDIEKLLLIIIYNYDEEIKELRSYLNNDRKLYSGIDIRLKGRQLDKYKSVIEEQLNDKVKLKKNAQKLGEGIDKVVALYNYDNVNKIFWINVVDSEEYIYGKKRGKTKNHNRFNKIDRQLKRTGCEKGILELFKAIIFSDFEVMFIDEAFGTTIKTLVLENMAINDKTLSVDELNKLRMQHSNAYSDFFKKFTFSDAVVNMKECIENNIQYLDIDKMLLTCAYRLEECMEKGRLPSKIRPLVQIIYDNISAKDKEFSLNLYLRDGEEHWKLKKVAYSAEKIKRFIGKFTGDSYLTESEIKEKRNLIQSGKLTLFDTKRQLNDLAFTDEQLEEVAFLSDENFAYVAFRLEWNRDKIIESIKQRKVCSGQLLDAFIKKNKIKSIDVTNLYLDGFVSIEHINELKKYEEKNECDKIVNSRELVEYCVKGIQEGATEEDKQKYNKYVELYKAIKLSNKQEINDNEGEEKKKIETEDAEIQDTIAELMEIVLEYYNQDDNQKYINIQGDLYIKGILSIDDLKEWNEENKEDFEGIFSQLYMRNKITLAQIRELINQKKLDFKYMSKLVATEGLEREKRMEVLNQGWIDEEDIYILFLNDYINEDDLLHLANLNITDKPKSESLIRNKNNPDNSQFQIVISGNLKKIKYESDRDPTNDIINIAPGEENRIIIDPNERLKYFDLLGAKKVEHVRIPKDSPFYEYEFFALPDKNGEFGDDSIVIAERFYEETEEHVKQKIDAETEQTGKPKIHYLKYATDNATYFFKGRDIIALKEYTNKSEAVSNDEIIFKVDHNLADDSRVGSWASGVLYAITKAMLSNDFKRLTKKEKREIIVDTMKKYYGHKKFMDILDKGAEIDRGEYNGDLLDEYDDIVL